MAPISKENEVLVAAPDTSAAVPPGTGTRGDDTASRPQPVALEVPVTVNGARAVEGSDKREPFSETTKTVLVFGGGAVIRLGSPVSPGQLLFLTNEKTKKEVVCQVVKSKNYRNVSGYVELEFTESVVGFWGMRFPSDRVIAHAPSAPTPVPQSSRIPPIAPASSGISKTMNPPVTMATKLPECKPAQIATGEKSAMPGASKPEAPQIPAGATSVLPQARPNQQAPLGAAIPPEKQTAPANAAAEGSSEEMKLETARLQEQLSSMLFNSAPTAKTAQQSAPPDSKSVAGLAAKIFEIAKPDPIPVKAPPVMKPAPPPIKSALDTEEVRIPSWLEPLARNAAAPPPEVDEPEKNKHAAETTMQEEPSFETAPTGELASEREAPLPAFGRLLSLDEGAALHETSSRSSRRGLWIGATAAAVLLAAGAAWFQFYPSKAQQAPAQPISTAPGIQADSVPPQQQPEVPSEEPAAPRTEEAKPESPARSTVTSMPNAASLSEPLTKSPADSHSTTIIRDNTRGSATTIPTAIKERMSRPAPPSEPKKPALGDVHLAAPTLTRSETTQEDNVVAPTLSTSTANANSEGFDSGLAAEDRKQPAAPEAPLPIGGDVNPARLISQVAPMYPMMAKNQHVSGDVVIDALIDVNGRVTTMKVISGPALLHQAAKDALRQWKYRPASLDGKAVPMHLSVTLQFRMQ